MSMSAPLDVAEVAVRLPAADLDRARVFWSDTVGLEPPESRPGGLRFRCGESRFVVFQFEGRASGTHTQMAIWVPELDPVVAALKERGLEFDEPDPIFGPPDPSGAVYIDGAYPSTGATGERAVWFHDSEGNVIGISEPLYPSEKEDQ
jgi:catechol 2,3-dioxygenase-like lactoylglutathione lyase family enzyme